MVNIIFFFFSSRRRHTRLTCDWSSDVCSSDLADETRCDKTAASADHRSGAGQCARSRDCAGSMEALQPERTRRHPEGRAVTVAPLLPKVVGSELPGAPFLPSFGRSGSVGFVLPM